MEQGGRCTVWVVYRDAEVVINIHPARSKTSVDVRDKSSISCDTQKELLASILGRVDLPE